MSTLKTLVLVILAISILVFIIFFGRIPALRHTPIGFINRLIVARIPHAILALDKRLTRGRLSSSLRRFGSYIVNDRHPTIVIFFLLLLSVSEYMYLPAAWPDLSPFHRIAGSISACLPYIFLYLAAAGDPGYITHANHAEHMKLYPYDFSIYLPGHECRTCRFLKPARSKHCSICKKCVSKMDHHCIFINKCVGYGNQHWFLLLLFTTAFLATYGAVLGFSIMTTKMKDRYPLWSAWPPSDLEWSQYLIIWSYGLQHSVGLGATTLLTAMLAPMVWGLLGYSLFLVYCGTTTNETGKWADWKFEMDDGYAFKRRMSPHRQKFTAIEPAFTRWPVETEQILTRSEDGRPPPEDAPLPGEGSWQRVWTLKDVVNMYDLGFMDNLRDVFIQDCHFDKGKGLPSMGRPRRHKSPKASL
ncbi:related to SWF1 Spore Wall Formation [Cephalotrichum gorgonifer]|uniref:Palmitoyltransferase n=1 Tax=Cephalotrichum gorgonifer TaxID=2041049 RepID=A0AAE8MY65_9PEZI|nr:related to SWF1 Spore Wall Formation [Cephalotrichum gorgonifer]